MPSRPVRVPRPTSKSGRPTARRGRIGRPSRRASHRDPRWRRRTSATIRAEIAAPGPGGDQRREAADPVADRDRRAPGRVADRLERGDRSSDWSARRCSRSSPGMAVRTAFVDEMSGEVARRSRGDAAGTVRCRHAALGGARVRLRAPFYSPEMGRRVPASASPCGCSSPGRPGRGGRSMASPSSASGR